MDLERDLLLPLHSESHIQGTASMPRPCSPGMLILLSSVYFVFFFPGFLIFWVFCLFLAAPKGYQQITSLVAGLQRGEFVLALLRDSEAYGKLLWSRGPDREEDARSDCLVESNGSELEVRPQRLPCPPACLL